MTEHKATPEQWALVERYEASCFRPCLLELRDRVEALEAAAKPVESNAPESSDSLVELVADAIKQQMYRNLCDETRAAILAVAEWLDQKGLHSFAKVLRQEVQ